MNPSRLGMKHTFSEYLLALIIIISTSLDYLWIGRIPLWLSIVVVFGLAIPFINHQRRMLSRFLSMVYPVIIAWVFFILIVFMLLATVESSYEQYSKWVFLNATTLLLFIVVGTWSACTRPHVLVYIICFVAFSQGVICIAQYLGSDNAWNISIIADTYFGGGNSLSPAYHIVFSDLDRVRGTNIYIHKFNAMQGLLVAYLFVIAVVYNKKLEAYSVNKNIVRLSSLVGFVGMFLTFSRSTLLGIAITAVLIAIKSRRAIGVMIFALIIISVYFIALELGFELSGEATRIVDFNTERTTNASRIEHVIYSLKEFMASPLIGEANTSDIGESGLLIHSVLLRILTNFGLVATIPYLLVLWGIYKIHRRKMKAPFTSFAIAGTGMLIVAVVDSWTHSSGILVSDVAQPALLGATLGSYLGVVIKNKNTIGQRSSA